MSAAFGADAVDPIDARRRAFRNDVLQGLAMQPKRLPSKWFYDARGSALFESICAQPEYYLTRAELDLMVFGATAMAAAVGPHARVVEFGSGSGIKTHLLLKALEQPAGYAPMEISRRALELASARLRHAFPDLPITPVCADFTRIQSLPALPPKASFNLMYFPGSTLGNFDRDAAIALLRRMRALAGSGGKALIGVDLVKDVATLEAAYNDAAGVTAAFTLNLLARINRELDGDFVLDRFRHRARWNAAAERIETRIESLHPQRVHAAGAEFSFAEGEPIEVEISCKYTDASFARIAQDAGWRIERSFRDPGARFAVFVLE